MAGETPNAPDSLPNYLAGGLPKQDVETLRDVQEFCEELIQDKQRPVEEDIPTDAEPVEDHDDSSKKGTVVKEKVTCGDENCACMNGGDKHGPYKYRYYRNDKGDVTSEYVGKAE